MPRPPLEVADIVRSAGPDYIHRNRRFLTRAHLKVLTAIARCRTAALGGHVDECTACGYRAISFNSCRDRHCPKCQAGARQRWLAARQSELLPTRYSHVVFTLPHELAPLALQNKKVVYDLLFRKSAETLIEVAADPRHLGAEIGFVSVLHTWNQKMEHHPHVHSIVAAGGLSADHKRWITARHRFFLPVRVLGAVFRGKFVAGLRDAFAEGLLQFRGSLQPVGRPRVFSELLRQCFRNDWVVYCKKPFGGAEQALKYLSGYTHRVAISNHRLISFDNDRVTFRWRDSAHKNKQRLMTLGAAEFVRRFLLHVLPRRFVRIRHFGFLAYRRKRRLLPVCFHLLSTTPAVEPANTTAAAPVSAPCPCCGGPMVVIERLTALQLRLRSPPLPPGTAA